MNRQWFFIIIIFFCSRLFAQLSPGDLANSHSDLDGLINCTKCHELGEKVSPKKCLGCHSILKERMDTGLGLHAQKEYRQCIHCHSDHQGTDFNLIWWKNGRENFDHAMTGYQLMGKHKILDCQKCHRPENIADRNKYLAKRKKIEKTYLGLGQKCFTCHHDEHRGQMSNECGSCHSSEGWKPSSGFDHNKTDYPLLGRHARLSCQKCHFEIRDNKIEHDKAYLKFSGLKFKSCTNCHKDPHKNRFSNQCESCHNTAGWQNYARNRFDHNKTQYSLKGEHAKVRCDKCHLPGKPIKINRFKKCTDCHNDYHRRQFVKRQKKGVCDECHSVYGFTPAKFTVTQHQKSNYPLQGAHLAVPCNQCHIKSFQNTARFHFNTLQCVECHTDRHKGEVDKYLKLKTSAPNKVGCEYCHSVLNWKMVNYDHLQTGFPLTGKHEKIACGACHNSGESKAPKQQQIKFSRLSKQCQSCHKDVHQSQFTEKILSAAIDNKDVNQSQITEKILLASTVNQVTDCGRCHTPLDWLAEKFIHNRDAQFKLQGVHRYVQCTQCHKTEGIENKKFVRYKPLDVSCSSCHTNQELKKSQSEI
jgi:hypothetical protein